MALLEKFRDFAARHAAERRLYAEMSQLSDAELQDLNISRANIAEISRAHAWSQRV